MAALCSDCAFGRLLTTQLSSPPFMEPELTPESGIRIPYERLPSATLRSVIEEYVTRDGTEMTDSAVKIESVLRLLDEGEVEVWFDPVTQTCNILRC